MPARLLLLVLSGLAYGTCFPALRWRGLAWVALVPLLLALRGLSTRRALVFGFAWGTLAAVVTSSWMPGAIMRYWGFPWIAGVAVLLGGAILTASIFYMLFAAWYAHATRAGVRATMPLLAAAAWVATELGRTEVLIGNPWALLGYSQIGALPLMQVADLAGVYGISFPIAAANAALAELWVAWRGSDSDHDPGARRAAVRGALSAAAVIVAVLAYGALRLAAASVASASSGPAGDVVVVQGNLDLGTQWRDEHHGANLEAYLTMTRTALAEAPAPLVVWPENALTFFVDDEPAFRAAIAGVLAPHGAQLLVGGPRKQRTATGDTVFQNAAYLLDPRGAVRAWYEKRLLVPFAEAFPLAGAETLRRRFGRVREFSPGAATPPLPTALGPAGVLICNEAMFPALATERIDQGSGWLANLTNDTWVGDPTYAALASDMEVLRAVEQRRYLVRSSTGGPSLVVDPTGRVLAEAPFATAATLRARIAASTQRTPYARAGDLFAGLCLLAAIVASFVAWRADACDARAGGPRG